MTFKVIHGDANTGGSVYDEESCCAVAESTSRSTSPTRSVSQSDLEPYQFTIHFEQARLNRANSKSELWFGIMGTVVYLDGIREDLEWVRQVAAKSHHHKPWNTFCKERKDRRWHTVEVFIIIHTLVFLFEINYWDVAPTWQNITVGPIPDDLLRMGALYPPIMFESNEWWRLLSSIWIYSGALHFFPTVLFMGSIGTAVENAHGPMKTSLCFLCCGVGGNLIGMNFNKVALSAAGSVGLFGWLGMGLADVFLNLRLLYLIDNRISGLQRNFLRVAACILLLAWCWWGFTKTRFIDGFSHGGAFWLGILFGLVALSPIESFPLVVPLLSERSQTIADRCTRVGALVLAFASTYAGMIIALAN